MDLELEVRTRRAITVNAEFVRELEEADIVALETNRNPVVTQPLSVDRLRASHHEAAKAFAEGLTYAEVAIRTGFSIGRLNTLKVDPAFQNLIETYQALGREAWADNIRRAATVNLDFLEAIQEKLEEGDLTTNELFRGYELTGKMAGLGQPKQTANVQVNVVAAGRIEAARRRAKLIDGEALPLSPSDGESIA